MLNDEAMLYSAALEYIHSAGVSRKSMYGIVHDGIVNGCRVWYPQTLDKYIEKSKKRQTRQQAKKDITNRNGTLCWYCNKACGGCSWSQAFKPVKGWKATKAKIKQGLNDYADSYHVIECPEFVPDDNDFTKGLECLCNV